MTISSENRGTMEEKQNERQFDEIEIDLLQLASVLWEKVLWILGSAVVFALVMLLITQFLITPMYKSTASLYVINRQGEGGSATSSDLSAATSLTYDFEEMVTTNLVLQPTIDRLDLELSTRELKDRIAVQNPSNTRILKITVEDEDPKRAKQIVDTLAEISADAIVDVMEIEKVNSIDQGEVPKNPSSPSLFKNVVLGGMVGFLLACGIVVLKFLLDDTVKSADDVEKYLGLSVLGAIPDIETGASARKSKNRRKAKK